MNNGKNLLKNSALALSLLMVGLPVAYAATDTAVGADTATAATPPAQSATTNQQNDGFDDWGLLGLLGLLGLMGLRKNKTETTKSVVVEGTRK
jgi:hypothetical protein